jgi:hypothetical protein
MTNDPLWIAHSVFTPESDYNIPMSTDGIIGIQNNDPHAQVEIREIFFRPHMISGRALMQQPSSILQAYGYQLSHHALYRVSSVSGGSSLTAIKHSPESADIPSQVAVKLRPTSATLGDFLRKVTDIPGVLNPQTATSNFSSQMAVAVTGKHVLSNISAFVNPIVLREGEGLGLVVNNGSSPHIQWGFITLRNQSTGACYHCWTKDLVPLDSADGRCMLSVVNGSGSGVVLEAFIHTLDAGISQDNYPSYMIGGSFRIQQCAALQNGVAITPYCLDPRIPAYPYTINVLLSPKIVPFGGDLTSVFMETQQNPNQGTYNTFMNYQYYALCQEKIFRGCNMDTFWQDGVASRLGKESCWHFFSAPLGKGIKINYKEAFALAPGYFRAWRAASSSIAYNLYGMFSAIFHNTSTSVFDVWMTYHVRPVAAIGGSGHLRGLFGAGAGTKETGANARGGSGTCMKMNPSSTTINLSYEFLVPVTAATLFTLNFYHKITTDYNGSVKVTIFDSDDDATVLLNAESVSLTNDGSYHQYTSTGCTPTNTGFCRVIIDVLDGSTSGDVYIDDIAVG